MIDIPLQLVDALDRNLIALAFHHHGIPNGVNEELRQATLLLRFERSRSTFHQPPLLSLEFLFAKHALVTERFEFSQLIRHANT
ncbi:MAG: hypothetical protein WCE23_15415 [Candidatus Binatus sp.]|uniref:hypothetical protein n=1 Tax=Candidatus Binatus sp. TaxID=2811406 RepID=UPI003C761A62